MVSDAAANARLNLWLRVWDSHAYARRIQPSIRTTLG